MGRPEGVAFTKIVTKKKLMKHLLVSFQKARKENEFALIRQASGQDPMQMTDLELKTWRGGMDETEGYLRRWAGLGKTGEKNPFASRNNRGNK